MHRTERLLAERYVVNREDEAYGTHCLTIYFSVSLVKGVHNLLRTNPNRCVFRQVPPRDGAVGVEQKLSRPRDVLALRPGVRMQQIIAANHLPFRIRQKGKRVPHLTA